MPRKYSSGFTLIEVVIVIAIVGILAAVLLIYKTGMKDDEALKAAGRELASVVRAAQGAAVTGTTLPVEGGDERSLCAYHLEKKTGTSYEMYLHFSKKNDPTDCTSGASKDSDKELYELPNGVQFDNDFNLSFSIPDGGLTGSTSAIILKRNSRYLSVCIYASGKVMETDVSSSFSSCP